MTNSKQTIGRIGEEKACSFLLTQGHTIINRNWRNSHLELDIISLKDKELHIVEVKTRVAPIMAAPQENVTHNKQARMIAAAKAYLNSTQRKSLPKDLDIYFDVISVVLDGPNFELEYYPQAFIPIYA